LGAWCGAVFSDFETDSILENLTYHFSIITVFSIAAAFWVSRNLIYDKPETSIGESGPLFRIPAAALLSVGIIAFCCMIGEGAMTEWSVNYMENIIGASTSVAPIALSAFATAMTIGRIFGDRVRARYGDSNLIIAVSGLCTALIVSAPYFAIAGFFLVGIGLSTIVPIAYSIAGNEKGLPSGVGIAMVTTVGYSGFLFGPPMIGFVSHFYNLRAGLALVLILFVIMTILGLLRSAKQGT
jgi:fucose permease